MTATALRTRLEAQGFRFWIENGRLQYSAPAGSITAEILAELRSAKADLLDLLGGNVEASRFADFANARGHAPLTFAQQRLWFLDNLLSEQSPELAATFNNPLALDIRGDINRGALGHALAMLVDRHAALRTEFFLVGERPRQRPGAWGPPILAEHACASLEAALAAAEAAIILPIALGQELPFRATLFGYPGGALLLLLFHHIISDGWSMEIVTRELIAFYTESIGERSARLAALPLDFFGYARWEERDHAQGNLESDIGYWRRQLAGAPQLCSPPPDRPRPASQSFRTGKVRFALPADELAALKAFCRSSGFTLFAGLLTAFTILVSRYTGEEDVVLGTASACRFDAALEPIVGYFANTLVMRVQVSPTDSFATLVRKAQHVLMEAEAAQRAPFEQVVAALQPRRSFAHSPLFQIFFTLQITEAPSTAAAGLDWVSLEIANPLSPYDLNVHLRETPAGLAGYLQFSEQLFDQPTIEAFAAHFRALINAAVAQGDAPGRTLRLCRPDEAAWDDYSPALEMEVLPRAFEHSVGRHGTRIAVSCGEQAWSYAALNRRSNRIARHLIAQRVRKGSVVAILVERGPDLLASLLAVGKAGAAYLPLDPATPAARLHYILEDAQATHVIATANALPGWLGQRLAPETVADDEAELAAPIPVTPDDLAYVIYTSGSTGMPKGVAVTHGNLASHLADMVARTPVTAADVWLALTTVSFDIAALELFAPIVAGACVEIASEDIRRDGAALGEFITQRATIAQATPTGWSMILDAGWRRPPGLKLLVGGEALRRDLLQRLTAGGEDVLHLYGPTETTIWSTTARLGSADRITIGVPIAGTFTLVLDDERQPVPLGLPGRLHIGGAGVAQGYWRQPERTAQAFIASTLSPHGDRLYDTGDTVRRLPDGRLQFVGRNDAQVKMHGHRIELGEIEACLARTPGARQVAAVVHGEGAESRLIGYCEVQSQPAPKLEFGIFFFSGARGAADRGAYRFILEAARAADEMGISSVWTPERHFHEVGGLYPNPALLGAAIAVNTRLISIRAGSVVLPLHDPLRVAEEWSVVDNLSRGRVQLALAAGWNARDFALRPGSYAERHALLEHDSKTVAQLWRGEPLRRETPSGPAMLSVHPRPRQAELPIWITASNSVGTFELAGRLGCGILTHLLGQSVDELEVKLRSYREALADAGWPADRARVAVMLHTFLGADDAATRAEARPALKEYLRSHVSLDQSRLQDGTVDDHALLNELLELSVDRYLDTATLIGSVGSCTGLLNELTRAGATEIACLLDFGLDPAAILASMTHIPALSGGRRTGGSDQAKRLAEAACSHLPDYMRPTDIVLIDAMPLTSSGKIDRRALSQRPPPPRAVEAPTAPPGSADEIAVAQVWEALLQHPAVSIHENFFKVGGNSLLASQMVAQLRERFGRNLALRSLFQHPTIAGLVDSLSQAPMLAPAKPAKAGGRAQPSHYGLSPQQRFHWEFEREQPDHPGRVYNKVRAWRIRAGGDLAAIRAAANAVCLRHQVFRLSICDGSAEPACVEVPAALPVWGEDRTLAGLDREAQDRALAGLASEDLDVRFDLRAPPPLRLRLVALNDNEAVLIATFHTMLMDGWAGEVFIQQILDERIGATPNEALRYTDLATAADPEDEAYWKSALAGLPAVSLPPADHPRRALPDFAGDRFEFTIRASLLGRIEAIAQRTASTVFIVLATALMQKLAHWAEREDVAIATLHGGRGMSGSEQVIGSLANTLALRTRRGGHGSFLDRLRETRETIIAAYVHHRLPYVQAAAHAEIPPPGALPAAQVVLVMHNQPAARAVGGITIEEIELPTYVSRYELCFALTEADGALVGRIEYQTGRFGRAAVERFCDDWLDALTEWVSEPDLDVARLAGSRANCRTT